MSQPIKTFTYKVEVKLFLDGPINQGKTLQMARERVGRAFSLGAHINNGSGGVATVIGIRELDHEFQYSFTGLKEGEKASMQLVGEWDERPTETPQSE